MEERLEDDLTVGKKILLITALLSLAENDENLRLLGELNSVSDFAPISEPWGRFASMWSVGMSCCGIGWLLLPSPSSAAGGYGRAFSV